MENHISMRCARSGSSSHILDTKYCFADMYAFQGSKMPMPSKKNTVSMKPSETTLAAGGSRLFLRRFNLVKLGDFGVMGDAADAIANASLLEKLREVVCGTAGRCFAGQKQEWLFFTAKRTEEVSREFLKCQDSVYNISFTLVRKFPPCQNTVAALLAPSFQQAWKFKNVHIRDAGQIV
jgi:hypothetical protein